MFVLAESNKFDRSAPYRVCDLSDPDGIVTDVPFPDGSEWAGLARCLNVLASAAPPP